jgi:putative sigma-54 modulation protein
MGGTMQVNVSLKHVEISDTIRERIEKKLKKLERFSKRISSVDIILEKNNARNIAEILARVGRKKIMASGVSYDMRTAFDEVYNKVERDIRRYEERVRTK